MFSETWFLMTFIAMVVNAIPNANVQKGINLTPFVVYTNRISILALYVFLIIGIFCADHWWQPLLAAPICLIASGIIGGIILSIFRKSRYILGAITAIAGPILTVLTYIYWF